LRRDTKGGLGRHFVPFGTERIGGKKKEESYVGVGVVVDGKRKG